MQGPILFVLYITPLDEIFSHQSVGHNAFSEVTHLLRVLLACRNVGARSTLG